MCSSLCVFCLYCYFYVGFNTFNQPWITLRHHESRINLQNGPFRNIKCTEITWTRLNLCSRSRSSWRTDGQRVIMDSREVIMSLKKSGKMEEESFTAAGPPPNVLYFHGSACQTPGGFPHALLPSLKAVPEHTTWCLRVPLYHFSQKRYNLWKDAPPVTPLESQACCWGAVPTFAITPLIQPAAPPSCSEKLVINSVVQTIDAWQPEYALAGLHMLR